MNMLRINKCAVHRISKAYKFIEKACVPIQNSFTLKGMIYLLQLPKPIKGNC